jgi:hypothetical protein
MAFIQFQLRRGTAAEWTAADPVLAEGEIGIETDTDLLKIGNGVDVWSLRPYIGTGTGGTGGVVSVNDQTGEVVLTAEDVGAVSTFAGVVVVNHGSDETVARPAGAAVVYWIGFVPPLNGQNADIWYPAIANGSGSGS